MDRILMAVFCVVSFCFVLFEVHVLNEIMTGGCVYCV